MEGSTLTMFWGDTHGRANQNETAIPVGISPQFISSAREFRGTYLVARWDNLRSIYPNGRYAPYWDLLPHHIRGIRIPVEVFLHRA